MVGQRGNRKLPESCAGAPSRNSGVQGASRSTGGIDGKNTGERKVSSAPNRENSA